MIEKIRLFATKPLKKKFKMDGFFQIYPDFSFDNNDKCVHTYPFIVELKFDKPEAYTRFSSNYGSAFLEKKIIEFCHLFTLASKFYIWGFEYIKELLDFSEIDCEIILFNEIEFVQNKVLDDRNIEEITIPKYTELIFQDYLKLNDRDLDTFRISLYQYYLGLEIESINKSLSLTLIVCCIETLVDYEYKDVKNETCKCCGNKIFQVTKKFKDFIYYYNPNKPSDIRFKKFVDSLYQTRSKILHSGKLLSLDLNWKVDDREQTSEEYFLRKDAFIQIRICLTNWLINRKDSIDVISLNDR